MLIPGCTRQLSHRASVYLLFTTKGGGEEEPFERRVRHTIEQYGGFVSEKLALHEFVETGRGVLAKQKRVLFFEN